MQLNEDFMANPLEKDKHGCMPNAPGPTKTLWCSAVNMCVSPDNYDKKGCESIMEMIKFKASGICDNLFITIVIAIILYFYFS